MINRQHFKATPLANILKRAMNVTPLDEERNKVEVLGDVLKGLRIDPKDTSQVRRGPGGIEQHLAFTVQLPRGIWLYHM